MLKMILYDLRCNMDYNQKSLKLHEELKGKIEVISRVKVGDAESLATA